MRGTISPISEDFSEELRKLILSMLHLDPNKRPDISQIMAQPLVLQALMSLYTDQGKVTCRRYLSLGFIFTKIFIEFFLFFFFPEFPNLCQIILVRTEAEFLVAVPSRLKVFLFFSKLKKIFLCEFLQGVLRAATQHTRWRLHIAILPHQKHHPCKAECTVGAEESAPLICFHCLPVTRTSRRSPQGARKKQLLQRTEDFSCGRCVLLIFLFPTLVPLIDSIGWS